MTARRRIDTGVLQASQVAVDQARREYIQALTDRDVPAVVLLQKLVLYQNAQMANAGITSEYDLDTTALILGQRAK